MPEVAKELEMGPGLLYHWVRKGGLPAQLESSEADKLRRLRRELAHLRLEHDILKKASVIRGTSPLPANMR